MTKKIFIILVLIAAGSFAQSVNDKFDRAAGLYADKVYTEAYDIFKSIYGDLTAGNLKRASSKYFAADCLLKLNELDGAVVEFESYITNYHFSNFRDEAFYKLGKIYYTKGEYRKARERLVFLNNYYPTNEFRGEANYWIGESFAAENKFFEAGEYLKQAISAGQKNQYIVNSIYSLAEVYEKQNEYSDAVKYYDELLAYYKDHPLGPLSQLRIGICYFKLGEYDNAVLELSDPLIRKLPADEQFQANYFLANSFVRLKEYDNAAAIYKEILLKNNNIEIRNKINYSLAWVNFQTANYESAYKIFNELQKSSNDSLAAESLYWSGECKRYLGDTKSANEIYQSFIKKYPDNRLASRAQLGMGTIYYGTEKSNDAEKALMDASVSSDMTTKGRANTILGEMRLNEKKYKDASGYFQNALKFTSQSVELNRRAKLGLGVADFYLNNINESIAFLGDLEKNSPGFESDKVNFYLAECYLIEGKYASALKHYSEVNNEDDQFKKQVIYGKAYTYFNSKDFPNAIYYFNEFVSKYSRDKNINDAKLRLADSYFGIKNFAKASAIYSELFRYDKSLLNNDFAFYQYCQALYKAGKSSDAINAFNELQERFPYSRYADVSQYVIGWIHFQQGDYSNAIINYDKLLNKYPKSQLKPIAYYSLGDSYFNQGQYDTSVVFYRKVLEQYPNTPYILDAVNGIQYAFIAKDEAQSAVDFIDNFIAAHPSTKYSDQIYFKKGDILYSTEKYEDAVAAYTDFILKYQSSDLVPNAYYWIGKSAANLKKINQAVENFSIVIQKWQKSEIGMSAAIELAKIYSDQKNYNGSIKVLDAAASALPTSNRVPELLYLKGVAQVSDSLVQNAYETFDQVIKYYDSSIFSAKSKIELGLLELNRNSFENADMFFKDLGENRTDDIGAKAQYYYGVSLLKQDKITDAITALVRVRSVFSGFDEWYTKSLLKLGDCYVKLKDKKQAREMYRAVINRHNVGELANEAKRKLNQL